VTNAPARLFVINHCLDFDDPILSHQASTVLELAKHFQLVTVLTGRLGNFIAPTNVRVISTEWKPGADLWNAFSTTGLGVLNLIRFRPNVVFSHMADLQASLLAPFIRILCIKHVLWYAHAHNSNYLRFASYFVNTLVSSTKGSMPIRSAKVRLIGQSIDASLFKFAKSVARKRGRYLHVGRIDSSKQIGLICESFLNLFHNDAESSLTFIGSSANPKSKSYQAQIFSKYQKEISEGKIKFLGAVPRVSLPEIYSSYDVFIHAFLGSLDKTLLEASAVGLPVLTINPEYKSEFGMWSPFDSKTPTLGEEISAFLRLDEVVIWAEVHRRAMVVRQSHSQEMWISKLLVLLLD
jgi:glycosyltransferase involved in cell wall biosynthesis